METEKKLLKTIKVKYYFSTQKGNYLKKILNRDLNVRLLN